jgi:hypothetical protein
MIPVIFLLGRYLINGVLKSFKLQQIRLTSKILIKSFRHVIENAWAYLKARLYEIPFTTLAMLKKDPMYILKNLQKSLYNNLVISIISRLEKCLANDGGYTKYG